MSNVSIRDLGRNASRVVNQVAKSGRPALVTSHGTPVVAIVPIDEEALEDFILANSPEFVRDMRQADRDLRRGRTRSAAEVFAELDREDTA
jgi:prevent-host-death family protein